MLVHSTPHLVAACTTFSTKSRPRGIAFNPSGSLLPGCAGKIEEQAAAEASMAAVDFAGATPLHLAATFGNTGAVQALLKAGAAPNMADR